MKTTAMMAHWRQYILITSGTCLCWTVIVLLNIFANVSSSSYSASSSYSIQSHEGSAPTSEFILNETSPNARIWLDASSKIVMINVEPPSRSHKVSLELLAMQLCDGKGEDRLKIVYSDPTRIKTDIWNMNVTFSEEFRKELKDIQVNQIVLISEGRWVLSGADIVATLYTDADDDDDSCPDNYFSCSCTSRCIPKGLTCNGNPNCGLGCGDDEAKNLCHGSGSSSTSSTTTTVDCETSLFTTTTTTEQSRGDESGGAGTVTHAPLLSFANVLFMIVISCVVFK